MYERIKSLYLAGRLTDAGLARAVTIGWINTEQMENIKLKMISRI